MFWAVLWHILRRPTDHLHELVEQQSENAFGSAPQVFNHRLGAGVDVEFFVNRPHVTAHSVYADLHAVGNFLVGITFRELIEKFFFTGSEF